MKTQVTVVMGVVIRDDKILMTQRFEEECPAAHLKWELPGGKIDFNEFPETSVKREIFEETGIRVEVIGLIPLIRTCTWNYIDGKEQHTILLAFNCRYISKEKQQKKDHHVKSFRWVSMKKIEDLEILPGDMDFVKKVLSG